MRKLLIFLITATLWCNVGFAQGIAEQLKTLNNLYKEGAITKEEFNNYWYWIIQLKF